MVMWRAYKRGTKCLTACHQINQYIQQTDWMQMYTSCMLDPDQRHTSSKVKVRMAAINAAPLQIGQQVIIIQFLTIFFQILFHRGGGGSLEWSPFLAPPILTSMASVHLYFGMIYRYGGGTFSKYRRALCNEGFHFRPGLELQDRQHGGW